MEFSILNLLLVLLVAWLAGLLATRLGYPSVLGELLAGIVLGPPLLGFLEGGAALTVLAEVGILLMMVYIGMEIDPRELGRASKAGALAAVGGFITPFVLCYLAIVWSGGSTMAAVFVGIAAGVTSLATKSRILVDLQLLDTRIAHVMMAGALIADTISLVLFAMVIGPVGEGDMDAVGLLIVAGKAVLFFGFSALLGLKVFPVLGRWLRKLTSFERTTYFTLVLLIALTFAELAELAGMHGILGAFVAGLFLRESVFGRSLSRDIMSIVRDASIGFLAPVFFVTAGFSVSLDVFSTDLSLLVLVVGLATVGKIVGTALFYLPTGYGWREGLTIGAGMNGRGAVEIIVAQIGLNAGLIDQNVFSILVFMALFTTASVPVLLKWGVNWLRGRDELVHSHDERDGVVVVGAGPTARMLARVLSRSQPVCLIDSNAEHCAFAESEGLRVVHGDALDEHVLSEAGAAQAKYFLTMTPNTEVNTLAARLARSVFQIPQICLSNHAESQGHEALLAHLHSTTLFGGAVSLEDWDHHISHDRLGDQRFQTLVLTIDVPAEAGAMLQRLRQTANSLPLAVRRGDETLPFHSGLTLQEGDNLHVVQEVQAEPARYDRFDHLVSACPMLDFDKKVSRDVVFAATAGLLAPKLEMDAEDLLARFLDRERTRTSVLLPGIAIPHVVVPGTHKFELLIARCREGVDFEEDPGGVHALFVLVGSDDERTFHLRALSAIAQVLQRDDFEVDWLKAPDSEALRRLVLGAERRRLTPVI